MIADFILDTIIFLLNATILQLMPTEILGFSITQFDGFISGLTTSLASSFNLANNFVDFHLLFLLLSIIITAEIMLHFGFKSIKYIINLFRGSGA